MKLINYKNGKSRLVLSKNQKKLVRKFGDAKGGESVSEICESVGVDKKEYYRLIEHPEFRNLLPAAIDQLLGEQLLPVFINVVQRAKTGSAKHAELVFKVAGLIGEDGPKILQIFGRPPETNDAAARVQAFLGNWKGEKQDGK